VTPLRIVKSKLRLEHVDGKSLFSEGALISAHHVVAGNVFGLSDPVDGRGRAIKGIDNDGVVSIYGP
jgi:hypothetical protein